MITDDLTITGLGADQLAIDAHNQSRIFEVASGNVELSGLTLTGGSIFSNPGGGAILNYGTLSVTDSTISDNSGSGDGGGIFNTGALSVADSTISRNYGGNGGGVENGGTLNVIDSTISDNSVGDDGHGGGIYNTTLGMLSIKHSTISGNSVGYNSDGGGIYNRGTMSAADSTISDNITTSGSGGGIYNNNLGTLSVSDSTINGNYARYGSGGGVDNTGTLSVTGSTISGNRTDFDGGGIINTGPLRITTSTISGNYADDIGGGIYNTNPLTVTNSTISGNSVGKRGSGGGIVNFGRLTITDSTISDNSVVFIFGNGGGIINTGTLSVTGSTISGNSTGLLGGGVVNTGTVTITNSTISGNSARYSGGAVYNDNASTLSVTNSTIVGNRADSDGGGGPSEIGGGLAGDAANVTLNNTIVAGNLRGSGVTPDDISWSYGTITAASHNLIGDAASSGGIANGVDGNIVGVSDLTTIFVDVNNDGKINASDLADNGGPTETYAPAPGSPAINAGDNSLVPAGITTDQRGAGYDRFVGTVDIGAVEEQNHSPTVSNLTVKTDENLAIVLSSDVFEGGYADAESDPMAAVRIDSLPADGVLLLDGQAVSAGEVVSRADLAGLAYQPGQNYSGNDSFSFSASDGISFAETDATLTVDVLTPRQALNDLIDHVRSLDLPRWAEGSLLVDLRVADLLLSLRHHNDRPVLALLDVFEREVKLWGRRGLIDPSTQATLVSEAQLLGQSLLSGAV